MQIDYGFWGFVVSVAALIAIVPLGFLTNALTPKILNWWAKTSEKSLDRRISQLKHLLEEGVPPTLLSDVTFLLIQIAVPSAIVMQMVASFILIQLGVFL